jgi:hypothetical protein
MCLQVKGTSSKPTISQTNKWTQHLDSPAFLADILNAVPHSKSEHALPQNAIATNVETHLTI